MDLDQNNTNNYVIDKPKKRIFLWKHLIKLEWYRKKKKKGNYFCKCSNIGDAKI
jgi:hypothetical protein